MLRTLDLFRRGRRAFTLIELLVVIAIIAVLIALLVPAVQKVREAASRIKCANNEKNLGVALHNYHDTNNKFPPAVLMFYAQFGNSGRDSNGEDPRLGPNWVCLILPYIEQQNLYDQGRPDLYNAANGFSQQWRVMRGTPIKIMQCPSNYSGQPPYSLSQGGGWERANYACNAGPGWWYYSVGGRGETEWPVGVRTRCGPVMGINYGVSLNDLTNEDGTAYTVLVNEVRIGVADTDPRGVWALGMPGSSVTCANAIGDCTNPNDANEYSDDVQHCNLFYYPGIGTRDHMGCWPSCLSWQAQARSKHPMGVNACFADGTVRFVRDDVNQLVWSYMLSRNDGQSYSYDN
jgi:prepilin-type N-terminal cleavage/methylation domain-containing protein